MSQYELQINGGINLSDYADIYEYIKLIGQEDRFTITMDRVDNENEQVICSMLKNKDFSIIDRGQNKYGKSYITAFKNK